MVKNLLYTALGLMGLMGILIVSTPSVNAYEDGIYTGVDENGNEVKTVIFGGNDTFSGVQLTIKMTDQTGTGGGYYNRGNNIAGDSTNYYGAENNDRWGGSGDTYENGFNPNPSEESKIARRGPCDSGYHVPSRGEWNELVTAWCNLTTGCSLTDSDDQNRNSGSNKLIYISGTGMGTKFKQDFSISSPDFFWSSSPYPDNIAYYNSWYLYLNANYINPGYSYPRNNYRRVRCLRNSIVDPAPQTFTLTFLDDDKYVRSGEIESGGAIPVDIISGYNLTGLTKEGYAFSGWIISGSDEMFNVETDVVTTGMTLNAVREINQYTITFDTDGGSAIEPITADYGTGITAPSNPTKNGYKFIGWNKEIPTTMPLNGITVKAIWEKLGSSGGGGGGGGTIKPDTQKEGQKPVDTSEQVPKNDNGVSSGSNIKTPENDSSGQTPQNDSNTPMDSSTSSQNDTKTYSAEFQEAYEFAKGKGITTMPTIQKADMNGKLTRIAMAKMLSQYAMNVLGQKPANIVTPKFNDVTDKQNSDYDDGVTLAYQLGIMGQNMPNNKFRPNDEVTRAEFATALSRMLYHTSDGEYKSTDKYYTNHMKKLVQEGIITNDDAKMKELRGYVMIMLMRSAK